MTNNSILIAKQILKEAESYKIGDMTQLRLMKLVYFVYGFYLGEIGTSLLSKGENVCAWKYGPVIVSLRNKLINFKDKEICQGDLDVADNEENEFLQEINFERFSEIVKFVLRHFGSLSITKLIDIVHLPSTPWYKVYHYSENGIIPEEQTRKYFHQIISNLSNKTKR